MQYSNVNPEQLEQDSKVFYDRLRPKEEQMTREIVDQIKKEFGMCDWVKIAGVGSILRYEDPFAAKDIDLAVSGITYSSQGEHNFDHVIQFTNLVERLGKDVALGLSRSLVCKVDASDFRAGSGPLAYGVKLSLSRAGQNVCQVETELDRFGWYGSKGFSVNLEGIRPIDIQFVFNMEFETWKNRQATLQDPFSGQPSNKLPIFPYAIL